MKTPYNVDPSKEYLCIYCSPGAEAAVRELPYDLYFDNDMNIGTIRYGDYILCYDEDAADKYSPMNRFIRLPNGDIDVICGYIAIFKIDSENNLVSIDSKEAYDMIHKLLFRLPQEFIFAFDKLFVLEIRNKTEKVLIEAIDLKEPANEKEEQEVILFNEQH